MATIAIPTSFITPFGDQGTTVFDIQNQSNLTMPSSAATCLIACYGALHTELATLSHQTLENVDIFADFTDNHTPLNPTNERLSITQLFVGLRLFDANFAIYLIRRGYLQGSIQRILAIGRMPNSSLYVTSIKG
jgi:hypothetical protein